MDTVQDAAGKPCQQISGFEVIELRRSHEVVVVNLTLPTGSIHQP
jgi:hypothetical protein